MEGNPSYVITQQQLQTVMDNIQGQPLKEVVHIYEMIKRLPAFPGGPPAKPAEDPAPEAAEPEPERNGGPKMPSVGPAASEAPGIDDELAKLTAGGRAAQRSRRRRH